MRPEKLQHITDLPLSPTEAEVQAELSAILSSRQFQGAARLCDFLRYIVEKTLSGQEQYLKEYVLGTDVFGRSADYDPRVDPIVRANAGRLRKKLDEYYAENSGAGQVMISLPKGHYIPVFTRRAQISSNTEGFLTKLPEANLWPRMPGLAEVSTSPETFGIISHNQDNPSLPPDHQHQTGISRRRVAVMIGAAALLGAILGWVGLAWLNNLNPVITTAAAMKSSENDHSALSSLGLTQAAQVAVPPVIDGLADTAWRGRIRNPVGKIVEGENNLDAGFGALWDVTNLYLMIEMRDPPMKDFRPREPDEIEIYFDTRNERQHSYQAHNFQFILPLRTGSPSEQNNRINGVRVSVVREDWGSRMEVAIPWSTLGIIGEAGRQLGFDLGIRRRTTRPMYLMWHGTADNWFDPSNFGGLTLAPDLVNAALTTLLPSDELNASTSEQETLQVSSPQGNNPGNEPGIVINFQLPRLPERVLSARLRLYCSGLNGQGRGQIVKVYGIASSEASREISKGDPSSVPSASLSAEAEDSAEVFQSAILIAAQATWYESDVTPVLRQAVRQKSQRVKLRLRGRSVENAGSGVVSFTSGKIHGQEPRLILEY